ncbi:hypothetical protein NDU88_004699 [Pleurodeles waltl]|uniref:Uncharacterized protein n=1 Tax=Pleurodeles waltl TaxID=8319 RepID=A0AAV7RLP1_PLEWA|nr:hypothetical protein NDU88_004697 [Pleurodeles waltl]KAJ1151920.1 hypothetical protein NDU88_004699 [Pleurodeles waltl]
MQRVAAGGRGSGSSSAVSVGSRMGEQGCGEHARSGRRTGRFKKQAQSPLESGGERMECILEKSTSGGVPKMAATSDSYRQRGSFSEERSLGGARKMASPMFNIDDTVAIISDDEVEEQWGQNSVECRGKVNSEGVFRQKAGKIIQWVPRAVSPMLHKVQAWEVDNQAVFKLGEQVEFVDEWFGA